MISTDLRTGCLFYSGVEKGGGQDGPVPRGSAQLWGPRYAIFSIGRKCKISYIHNDVYYSQFVPCCNLTHVLSHQCGLSIFLVNGRVGAHTLCCPRGTLALGSTVFLSSSALQDTQTNRDRSMTSLVEGTPSGDHKTYLY